MVKIAKIIIIVPTHNISTRTGRGSLLYSAFFFTSINTIMKPLHHLSTRFLLCFPAFCSILCLSATICAAQSFPPVILKEVLSEGLSQPLQVVNAGDGTNRLFIVQQKGTIKVLDRVDNDKFTDRGDFLDIGTTTLPNGQEQGLLSMVFDPGFSSNKTFYVYYTALNGDLEIARYQTGNNPYRADITTKQVILRIPHTTASNHNGGEMHFGLDGHLYVSTGDGGGGGDQGNNAQNTGPEAYLGKILRLDVSKTDLIPANNPFPNSLIYAYGLRNPFRWSFDRLNQDVWLGDVGQGAYEEINSIPFSDLKGANFGWRCYEGNAPYNTQGCASPDDADNYVFPVHAYPNTGTTKSVIGGVVYRGTAYPALYGYYFAADYYDDKIYMIHKTGNGFAFNNDSPASSGIADFGEAENGEVYVVNRSTNTLYRVAPDPSLPVKFAGFSASLSETYHALLNWSVVQSPDLQSYEVQRSTSGTSFAAIGTVNKKEAAEDETVHYSFEDTQVRFPGSYYYRIKAQSLDGTSLYSSIASLSGVVAGIHENPPATRYVLPNMIEQGKISLSLSDPFDRLEIISLSGQTVRKFELGAQSGEIVLDAGKIPAGIYIARLTSPGRIVTEKVIFP